VRGWRRISADCQPVSPEGVERHADERRRLGKVEGREGV
jgi:hypothetical protein